MSEFRYLGHKMPYLPRDGCTGKLIVIEGTDGVGRSTQAFMLKEWLEVQGYAVMDTGWTRSKLIGQAITEAKAGHSMHRLTYCLMYATDLADRLEYQIIPALRSGLSCWRIDTSIPRSRAASRAVRTRTGCAISMDSRFRLI